ncbi:DUF7373 family lipoprotein [Nocardia aurantia]|uniref:Uncharacterized protein n=1 Tax=Nocardia aurantia TaxID=2585199 RepID=A0A7K0DGW8_9NOCA|nr:hypothetical protein [Nocardia aurantia]MQY25056.1 hypothetical protein [Nocardia aurantia]
MDTLEPRTKRSLYAIGVLALVTVIIALSVQSCGPGVTGHAGPGLTAVDIGTLRTGSFAAQPTAYKPKFRNSTDFRLIEARRMLGYLVHPFDVDPDDSAPSTVKLISSGTDMTSDDGIPKAFAPIGQTFNVLAGVYVSRTNGNLRSRKKVIVGLLRFPTEDAARQAADQFGTIENDSNPGRHPITIADHPDAHASSGEDASATAFLAHGPYVVLASTRVPAPDQAALAALTKRTIDLQLAAMATLQPTPLDDLLDLAADPEGLMRRAAPQAKDYSDPFYDTDDFGTYDPAADLHYERNPIDVRNAFREDGVDAVARRTGVLYRTRDLAASFRLQNTLTRTGKDDDLLNPPPGLPDATCVRLDLRDSNRDYDAFCVVVYGRYVAMVVDRFPVARPSPTALYERTGAQYAILARSE